MAFTFGQGTVPEGLVAELDWPRRMVCLRVMSENKSRDICQIPLAQFLLCRECLAVEVEPYLQEKKK